MLRDMHEAPWAIVLLGPMFAVSLAVTFALVMFGPLARSVRRTGTGLVFAVLGAIAVSACAETAFNLLGPLARPRCCAWRSFSSKAENCSRSCCS
ncbi:MAG: hypothetical protein ABIP94_01835 [Planctomycetota bacterium]